MRGCPKGVRLEGDQARGTRRGMRRLSQTTMKGPWGPQGSFALILGTMGNHGFR